MDIQIRANHFKSSDYLNLYIKEKMRKIESLYQQIVSIDVSLKLENNGQIRDKIVEAKVDIPGSVIVSKSVAKTFEEAVNDCTKKIKRNLIRTKAKSA